jgi:hypothetical protein
VSSQYCSGRRATDQSLKVNRHNDLLKNLSNAEACLKNLDLKLTGDHIKVAKWNVAQVKKAIAVVGQAKTTKTD